MLFPGAAAMSSRFSASSSSRSFLRAAFAMLANRRLRWHAGRGRIARRRPRVRGI
jgi:hypothetical protein